MTILSDADVAMIRRLRQVAELASAENIGDHYGISVSHVRKLWQNLKRPHPQPEPMTLAGLLAVLSECDSAQAACARTTSSPLSDLMKCWPAPTPVSASSRTRHGGRRS